LAINSRDKGARGERELANKLKEYGYTTRRGQQYSGIEGQDVVGLDGIHIECKRVERLNIYDAVDQAKRDTEGGKPAVFHRKNHCEWLVTMTLDDWIGLYREWLNGGID
jgi:Holliday junction resolvase